MVLFRLIGAPVNHQVKTLDDIIAAARPVFQKYSIRKVILFGSFAKGRQTRKSDIDLILIQDMISAISIGSRGYWSISIKAFGGATSRFSFIRRKNSRASRSESSSKRLSPKGRSSMSVEKQVDHGSYRIMEDSCRLFSDEGTTKLLLRQ
jgi:hypothetical protein